MVQFFPQIGSIALTLVLWLSAASSVLAQGPCNNQTSVTYEGYTYEIVEIDGRCWYAENSKFLPDVNPVSQGSSSGYYVHGYDGIFVEEAMATSEYEEYGVLYGLSSAKNSSTCPTGWRLPSWSEYYSLLNELGGTDFAGQSLKSTEWNGEDFFGFSALPAGFRNSYSSSCEVGFFGLGSVTGFWTSGTQSGGSSGNGVNYVLLLNSSNSAQLFQDDAQYIVNNLITFLNDAPDFGCPPTTLSCCFDLYDINVSVRCILDDDFLGCTDPGSCNFQPFASADDGSCVYEDECGECGGDNSTCADECGVPNGDNTTCMDECGVPNGDNTTCMDECGVPNGDNTTCMDECGVPNGDNTTCMDECGVPNGPGAIYECGCADIPEGECDCEGTVPVTGYDCDGNCLNDADGDGVCDEFEVLGCTDITACNYEDDATEENGSCILQGDFCNDGDFLTIDDFVQADCSCNGFGCNDPSACNYSATALHQSDLCDFESCQGCLDDAACNYSSNSIIDDGSCYYVGDSCDDGDESSFNDSVQSDCSCEGDYIGGCTYWIACNYDPDAVIDDGSCTFIGELCDDLNPLTFNDIVDENCFCGDIAITNVGEWTFSGFKVYPNPSNGMVWVEAGGAGSLFDVNVYDSASRIVASKTGIDRLNLDVSNCAPGLYLIEVNVDGSMHRTQLILQ